MKRTRRRSGGHSCRIALPVPTPPSQVSNLVPGAIASTSFPVTFLAATGSAPMVYTGQTSTNGTTWSNNSGTFTDDGTGHCSGSFINLLSSSVYYYRIIATNQYDHSTTQGASTVTTSAAAATTFYSEALSPASGISGTTFPYILHPDTPGWPTNEPVTITVINGNIGGQSSVTITANGTSAVQVTVTSSGPANSYCTVNATAPSMTNRNGAEQFAIASPSVSGNATRYDLTIDQSAGPAGTARTITANPNANWSGGTIPLTAYNGGSSTSVGTITLPSSGRTAQTISWTPPAPATGEWIVKGANTAGMYDPYGAPFNVFSPSNGAARTIAASLSLLDMSVHQRDCPSGNPLGFSTSWAKGWGEVWITISSISGATDGIFVQLRDALNGDASLSDWIQVYGAVNGAGEIRVLLPAGPYVYHLGVSASSDGANAVQLAQRFKVGHNMGAAQRSYECGLSREFGYSSPTTLPTSYTKTSTFLSYNVNSANTSSTYGWYTHDGTSTVDPDPTHGEYSSAGTQEWGRLVEATYGVVGGIVGASMSTWGTDTFIAHDGTLGDGFGGTINFATRGKMREVVITMSDWDGQDPSYPTPTMAEYITRYTNVVHYIATHFPSVAVISLCAGASGFFGQNGSADLGYTRLQCQVIAALEAANPMVVSRTNLAWNDHSGGSGHSSMAARVQFVRTGFRQATAAETIAWGGLQTSNRGPSLIGTGTVNASGLIRLPGKLNGVTALTTVGIDFTNPTWTVNSASSAEIASLFSAFPTGEHKDAGTALAISSAVINTSSLPVGADFTIDVQLAAAPTTDLYVNYAADQGVSNSTIQPDWISLPRRSVFIAGTDIDTTHGYQFGWELRPYVDAVVARV